MNLRNYIMSVRTMACAFIFSVVATNLSYAATIPMLVISANDQASGYAGAMFVRQQARPGSVTIIDFASAPVRSWHMDGVPCSVIGPPSCIAVNAAGNEVLVAGAMQPDPHRPDKLRMDSRVTRLRFDGAQLTRAGEIDVGVQPSGIRISKDGKRAWVTLRGEGGIALMNLRSDGMSIERKWTFATAKESLSDIAISPDERTAFATLHTSSTLLIMSVAADGSLAEKQRLQLSRGTYHVSFFPDGKRALVGCTVDNVMCVIEERDGLWCMKDKIPTGRTPEGVFLSPDARWIAVTCFDGANMLIEKNQWFGQPSRVYIYSVAAGGVIEKKQTLEMKNVLQGAAFTADSRKLVVGQFGESNLRVFELQSGVWCDTRVSIEIPGQSASLTATRP